MRSRGVTLRHRPRVLVAVGNLPDAARGNQDIDAVPSPIGFLCASTQLGAHFSSPSLSCRCGIGLPLSRLLYRLVDCRHRNNLRQIRTLFYYIVHPLYSNCWS